MKPTDQKPEKVAKAKVSKAVDMASYIKKNYHRHPKAMKKLA